MLSPDPLATDGATCATRREVWGTGFECGAGDVPPVNHSVDEGVEPNAAERQRVEVAQRVSATLERTALALMHSAALAEDHAQRTEEAGRHDQAAKERLVAARAREAAWRTRARAAGTPLP